MWSHGLDLASIRFTIVKVVVSSEGTSNKCFLLKCLIIF